MEEIKGFEKVAEQVLQVRWHQADIMIRDACIMYDTAARLNESGMIVDANSLARKAKLLIEKAIHDVDIEEDPALVS